MSELSLNYLGRFDMIILATDFGIEGPYIGQMKIAIAAEAPHVPVVDLITDLPTGTPRSASYLLAAYSAFLPKKSICICVVDPGVGSDRRALCLDISGNLFIGPDNGLFEILVRRQKNLPKAYEVIWRPKTLSASFHGRDIFSPIAARLAKGERLTNGSLFQMIDLESIRHQNWADDLSEIAHIDHYGNAITGLRASTLANDQGLGFGEYRAPRGTTFSSVLPGAVLCYENSNGLMEIAINQGRASDELNLCIGDYVKPIWL